MNGAVHAAHGTVGWRWVVADHLSLRTSVGYVHAVVASSRVTVPASVSENAGAGNVAVATAAAESRLDELFTAYGKLPTVGLSMGYRF